MGVTPLVPQTSASTSSAILAKTRRSHHTEMIADGDGTALFLAGLGGARGVPLSWKPQPAGSGGRAGGTDCSDLFCSQRRNTPFAIRPMTAGVKKLEGGLSI